MGKEDQCCSDTSLRSHTKVAKVSVVWNWREKNYPKPVFNSTEKKLLFTMYARTLSLSLSLSHSHAHTSLLAITSVQKEGNKIKSFI